VASPLRRWIGLALLIVIGALAGAPGHAAERRVALVIGNAQYARSGAPTAVSSTVAANAAAVAEALRQAGFEVTTANNQEHRGFVATLSHFAANAKGADVGLLYYAGLALGLGGKSYLVPVDAKLVSEFDVFIDTIELDQILQTVRAARRGVVLLDPVMPNPLADALGKATAESGRPVQPVPGAPGSTDQILIAYAHQPDVPPVAVRGGGPGPFAAALAQEITKPGAELHKALAAVAQTVEARTNGAQLPWVRDRLGVALALGPAGGVPPKPPVAEPPPAQAMTPEPKVEPLDATFVTIRDVNMRAGPDNKAPVLRTVARDTEVTATGQARKGSWTQVTVDGQQGFIATNNLRPHDAPASEEPVAAGPLAPDVRKVARPAVLFDRPGMGARGLRELPAGMTVTVMEMVRGSNWVRVRDRTSQEGYVQGSALSTGSEPPPAGTPPPEGTKEVLAMRAVPPPSGPAVAAGLPPGARALSEPVQDAVRVAREAATSGENAATQARATAQRAVAAQTRARAAAETARAGTSRAWVHQFPNGDVYEGEWSFTTTATGARQLQKSGFGIYRFADGQRYEGEWLDDQMAGLGTMVFRTGDRYEGSFRAGQPDGEGVFRYANGHAYAGEVRTNRPEGKGELTYANGDRYQGQVADRLPSGFGALTLNGTGGKHVGRFRAGVQDGPGVATTYDGLQHSGTWQGGRMMGD